MREAGRAVIETRSAQMFPKLEPREIGRLRRCGEPRAYAEGERAIGDVRCGSVKRVAAAAGEGAQVAAALHSFLARARSA